MKVRCTGYNRDEQHFTIGKIYNVKNGEVRCDDGFVYHFDTNERVLAFLSHYYSFEEVTAK